MRAMILAAGLGRRLAPLSELRPKPVMPVLGIPVIGYLLALLDSHGIREVMVNLHHLPDLLRAGVESQRPPRMRVSYSPEEQPLGTGGAMRRAASFLRESDPCLVISGDMLLDLDLTKFAARHRERGNLATLALRTDPRGQRFGTIGFDRDGCVRRIGSRFDLGGEAAKGVFMGVRALASRAFDDLPERDVFEDLSDWMAPRLARGERGIQAECLTDEQCSWEPVGTPAEYLGVNLRPPELPFIDARALAVQNGTRIEGELILGAHSRLEPGAELERCVVWDGEVVPGHTHAADGVFAGGRFHPCAADEETETPA